jgi:hypothetical protein
MLHCVELTPNEVFESFGMHSCLTRYKMPDAAPAIPRSAGPSVLTTGPTGSGFPSTSHCSNPPRSYSTCCGEASSTDAESHTNGCSIGRWTCTNPPVNQAR